MKPVVLAAQPLLDAQTESYFGSQVEVRVARNPSPSTLVAETPGAHAIFVRAGTHVGQDVFDAGQGKLLVVTSLGSGVDMIDVEAATAYGVPVLHNPGLAPTPVVEYVIGMIPMLRKRVMEADRAIRNGWDWQPRSRFFGREATGYRLGVVGLGHIGREVARRAKAAFDMEVIAYDPMVDAAACKEADITKAPDLATLLRQADVVTLHAPGTEATRHMIDESALAEMKPDAVLINAARGSLVDERALADALATGVIAAAAMDVFEPEPAASDNPLFKLPNFLATPHTAGMTAEALTALHKAMANGVLMALRGQRPPHLANPEIWPPRAAAAGFPLGVSR